MMYKILLQNYLEPVSSLNVECDGERNKTYCCKAVGEEVVFCDEKFMQQNTFKWIPAALNVNIYLIEYSQ